MPFWSPLALLAVALGLVITHFAVPTTRAWLWKASAVVGLTVGSIVLLVVNRLPFGKAKAEPHHA